MSPLKERIRRRLWASRINRLAKPRKAPRRRMIARPGFKSAASLRAYLEKSRPGARRR